MTFIKFMCTEVVRGDLTTDSPNGEFVLPFILLAVLFILAMRILVGMLSELVLSSSWGHILEEELQLALLLVVASVKALAHFKLRSFSYGVKFYLRKEMIRKEA